MPMEHSRSVIQGIHVQGGFNESVILKWIPTKGLLYIIIILILITPRECAQTLKFEMYTWTALWSAVWNFLISVGTKPCTRQKERELSRNQGGVPLIGAFITSCKPNGDYEEVQCHGSIGFCWCVDSLGNEVDGTRVRGEPNCTISGKILEIWSAPLWIAVFSF